MSTDSPDLFDAIDEVVRGALGAMHVIGIGTIDAYSPEDQTATVSSALKWAYVDFEEETITQVTPDPVANIPVLHMASGGFFSAMPVKAGDQGVILTVDRAIDSWKSHGGNGNETKDPRRFNMQDSLFLPCGRALSNRIVEIDKANEKWVWGEEGPNGFRFVLGEGKLEFGTPVVSFMQQLSALIQNTSSIASNTGSGTVQTFLGPQFLTTAGNLIALSLQVAQIKSLIDSIKGSL